jgi:hypothetical protein
MIIVVLNKLPDILLVLNFARVCFCYHIIKKKIVKKLLNPLEFMIQVIGLLVYVKKLVSI